jgi:Cof subfamily protein (haloacid dehalogenase superfamily)
VTFRLLALDLDDTLLNDKKQITPRTLEAVRAASAMGLFVVLATGRSFRGAVSYYDMLNANAPAITCGGAIVVNRDGSELFGLRIPIDQAREVLGWAKQNNIHAHYEYSHGYVFEKPGKFTRAHARFYGFPGECVPDLMKRDDIPVAKVLVLAESEILDRLQPEAERLFPQFQVARSLPTFLEFNHPTASKANALEFLATYLKVLPSEIIAIGDSELDRTMMEYAGLAIAMSNAQPAIQQIADDITSSNLEDGVALALEKYVL